ncbi:FecR family protein [Thalassolituus sp. LLYu03]|uniref:FecR family protein n=1 Tax=Thalassolituus sp. LLYu03 TaxID=3421656 RepID=UPI003D2CAA8C
MSEPTRMTALTDLEDQAFALLMAHWEAGDEVARDAADAALNAFALLSTAHQTALTRALDDWRIMGHTQIQPAPVTGLNACIPPVPDDEQLGCGCGSEARGHGNDQCEQQAPAQTPERAHALVRLTTQSAPRVKVPGLARTLALAACALLCAVLTPWLIMDNSTRAEAPALNWSHRISSSQYEQQRHTLPDGSEVVLNWASDVRFDFRADVRHVYLNKGEALFRVAKDKTRPFIVHSGEANARAVGTEFRVRRINRKEADIAVSEGIVAVSVSAAADAPPSPLTANAVTLTMNQSLRTGSADYPSIRHQSVAEITGWTQGRLVFEERPLAEVLTEISRYTDYRIVTELLPDPQAKVSATYFIAHTSEALDSLLQLFHLQGEFRQNRGGTELILRPALVL